MAPLLGKAPISKSTVSRVLRSLREGFESWRQRPLAHERIAYLLLDAIAVKVRIDRRVTCVPVLVAMGVRETGEKVLIALQLMGSESKAAWTTFCRGSRYARCNRPLLVIMDGNAGVARCVVHKLRNLEAHAPKRLIADLRSDFHAITEAETLAAAQRAYDRFRRVWRPRAESVVRSLEEAGLELLTFYAFPTSQRRSRTSNPFCACFLDSMRVDRLSCGRLTAGSISRKCSRDARRQHDRV